MSPLITTVLEMGQGKYAGVNDTFTFFRYGLVRALTTFLPKKTLGDEEEFHSFHLRFFFFFDSTRVGYVLNIRINCLKGKDQFSFIKIESCSTRKRKSNLRYVAGGIDDFSAWGKQQISIF